MNEQERQELEGELGELRAYAATLPAGSQARLDTEETIREGEEVLADPRAYAAKEGVAPQDEGTDRDKDDEEEGDVSDEEMRAMLTELGIDPASLDDDGEDDEDEEDEDEDDKDGAPAPADKAKPYASTWSAGAGTADLGTADAMRAYTEDLDVGFEDEDVQAPAPVPAAPAPAPAPVAPAPAPAAPAVPRTEADVQARAYAERQIESAQRLQRETIAQRADHLVETNRVLPAERNALVALAYTLSGLNDGDASGVRAYSDAPESRRDAVDDLFTLFSEREELGLTRQYTQGGSLPAEQETVRITVPGHATIDANSADQAGRIHAFMRQEGIKDFAEGMLKYEAKNPGQVKSYANR